MERDIGCFVQLEMKAESHRDIDGAKRNITGDRSI